MMLATLALVGAAKLVCPTPVPLVWLLQNPTEIRQTVVKRHCAYNPQGFPVETLELVKTVGEYEIWRVQVVGGPEGFIFSPVGRVDGGQVA